MKQTIAAYGGKLLNLLLGDAEAASLKSESQDLPSMTLSLHQLCDLELLMNGAYSPLQGFMNRETYESVLHETRLPEGLPWSIPITLDVPENVAKKLSRGSRLALCDPEGFMLAVMDVTDVWKPDKQLKAELVYATASPAHPGVRYLYEQTHDFCVGGEVTGVHLPMHYDFQDIRHTPAELRQQFEKLGWSRVVAFNTSKPMHRLHRDITLQVAKEIDARILMHPAVGMTKPGDLQYYSRVHCYQAIHRHYPPGMALLSLLPIAMRMAGPREALLNAIVRQNYGCSHVIVGPEHAAPPEIREGGQRFYPIYAAQEFVARYQDDLAIRVVPIREMRYVPEDDRFEPIEEITRTGKKYAQFSEQDLYRHLSHNQEIPSWFSFPDVIDELRKIHPPRSQQGITLFFTGLSGSGKSTLAKILYAKFIEAGGRPATLLDGDIVRLNLSSELGFSKKDRDTNIRRIGFVANEITKNGGIAICAPIAPYAATRRAIRELIEQHGAFIEIYISTPLEVCEHRDRKGLYAKARKGLIPEFTGVSAPYEVPERPEIRIDTSGLSPVQAVEMLLSYLLNQGYLEKPGLDKMRLPH